MSKKKQTVAILGATGMLGNGVYSVLKDKYKLVLTVRALNKVRLLDKMHGGVKNHRTVEFDVEKIFVDYRNKRDYPGDYLSKKISEMGDLDYLINAIGLVIAPSQENPSMAFFINSALPHILARIYGRKMIHITTDCVFDGRKSYPYNENSAKTPTDIYGLSKSLGEPTNCITIRTSIIGRELETYSGLLEWFLRQKGETITGFANHYWNGITTKQFGKVCDKIFSSPKELAKPGVYHVFSNVVSKYEMLLAFREKFNLDCKITRDTNNQLYRTLSTIKLLNSQLQIPSFQKMLEEINHRGLKALGFFLSYPLLSYIPGYRT